MKVTWTSRLGDIANQQLPYALAQAVNDLAKEAAEEARDEAAKELNVKRRSFLNAFIRAPAEHRATKKKLTARVVVAGPKSDPKRGTILAQHEERGVKTPYSGRFVAVPGREIMNKIAGKRQLKRGMALKNFKPFIEKGTRVLGQRDTFIVKSKRTGMPLLLQRQSKNRVRVLWMFVKQSRLAARLGFQQAVTRRVEKGTAKAVGMRLTQAIASAKEIRSGGVTSTRLGD